MKTHWTQKIKPGHHGYLIAGTQEKIAPEIIKFLEKDWQIEMTGNPDLIVHHYPNLYIEDSRTFLAEAATKPVKNEQKIFIISFGFMTREAANSLLKLFEEPPSYAVYFLVTPNPERLPSTLRSRLLEIKTDLSKNEGTENEEAEDFIKMNLGERFEYSRKFAKDISDEKRTRPEALVVLESIIKIIRKNYEISDKTASAFRELEKCRTFMKDQSASIKILFDEAAMILAGLQIYR